MTTPDPQAGVARGRFTRLGFVLAAAGSAVGLGNLWKFPYIAYHYGGGEESRDGAGGFILIYLAAIVVIGLPIMVGELVMGRRAQRGPVGALRALAADTPWWLAGAFNVLTGFVLLSYYAVVAGWTLEYILNAVLGVFTDPAAATALYAQLHGLDPAATTAAAVQPDLATFQRTVMPGKVFEAFLADSGRQVLWLVLFMAATMAIVSRGVTRGIERASRILMPVLLVILAGLVVRVMTMDGVGEAVAFLFVPSFGHIGASGVLEAIGHAFFTLSLGMGAMITYGSYLSRDEDLFRAGLAVTIADTLVALAAAFVMIGAIFSLGLVMESGGAGNLFIAIPAIFADMPGGPALMPFFYVLVAFAALTSAISVLEVVVGWICDEFAVSRGRAVVLSGAVITAFGLLSALSFSTLSDVTVGDRNIFSLLDYLVSNWALPLGGLLVAVFVGHVLGRGVLVEELGDGRERIVSLVDASLRFVAPIAIVVTIVYLVTRPG